MVDPIVSETNFSSLELLTRGKVRDIYNVGNNLLIVATDRISAFDVIMDDPVPDKGKILTKISIYWFIKLSPIIANHLISINPDEYPDECSPYKEFLIGRSMLVQKAKPLPVECVVRGYISGSGWLEYKKTGGISGVPLPEGLEESSKLVEPIFTPSTKGEPGTHDENISYDEVVKLTDAKTARVIKDTSLRLYEEGRDMAIKSGIIIADTKFEFGIVNDNIILIDEVLTPDSSRFWPADEYKAGGPQKSFDKQFLRDYLNGLNWSKQPPPPRLPAEIIQVTREKYLEVLKRLTGEGI